MSTPKNAAAALFVVSLVTLLFELTQIRVFAYSLNPLIAFSAIAIAMLGFGIGSTVVAIRPAWFAGDAVSTAGTASIILGISMPLVSFLFARTSPSVFPIDTMWVDPVASAIALVPCAIPYALAGIVVTVLLRSALARIGRIYFWNLAGSAAGCILVTWLLRSLGAERVVMLSAALALAVPLILGHTRRWIRVASASLAVFALLTIPWATRLIAFQPDPSDLIHLLAAKSGQGVKSELTIWDPVGRIDVVRHDVPVIHVEEAVEYRTITNDSGAMSLLIKAPQTPGWGKAIFEHSLYSIPYRMNAPRSVLVIGVGGGVDILTALHWKAESVTGVDVSLATLNALRGPYADFAGWPHDPRVTLIHEDGRSFAHRTSERFDLVQLTGVDTFTMHSASAMVTAEDYLYTKQAFADFIELLNPDGMLAVTRFGDEALSLASIAASALRSIGISDPRPHLVAIQQVHASGVVVKKSPFTDNELENLRRIEDRQQATGVKIPHYDESGLQAGAPIRLLYPQGRQPDVRYDRFFAALEKRKEIEVLRSVGNPFVVPTDDRPYYMLGMWMAPGGLSHPVIAGVATATLVIAVASLALILLPIVTVRRRTKAGALTMVSTLAFFFAIGASFMLLEVGLIHRTIVFVGSPGAAVSVVIASILLSASIGAGFSDRLGGNRRKALGIATAGMVVVGAFYQLGATALFDVLFGLPMWARAMFGAVALAPAGFFAGWFFPRGMSIVAARAEGLVPWAIAVNAFASVLGSLAVLFIGVSFGFRAVSAVAVAGYVIALLVMLPIVPKAKNAKWFGFR